MTITEMILSAVSSAPGINAEAILGRVPDVSDRSDMVLRLARLSNTGDLLRRKFADGFHYWPKGAQMPPEQPEEVKPAPPVAGLGVMTPALARAKIIEVIKAHPGIKVLEIAEALPEIDSAILLNQVLAALTQSGTVERVKNFEDVFIYSMAGLKLGQPSRHITPIPPDRAAELAKVRPPEGSGTRWQRRNSTVVDSGKRPGVDVVAEAAAAHPGLSARELSVHCTGISKSSVGGFLALALPKNMVSRARRDGIWRWYAPGQAPADDGSESVKKGGRGIHRPAPEPGRVGSAEEDAARTEAAGVIAAAALVQANDPVAAEPVDEEMPDFDRMVNKVKGIPEPEPPTLPKVTPAAGDRAAPYTGNGYHLAQLVDGSILVADYMSGNAMRLPLEIVRRAAAMVDHDSLAMN